jgi:aspyridone synthetase (hybrid polyketide synthase/nonribosomal peptide synthetase)
MSANIVRLHPRSSTYILRRSLPSNIGFVLALSKDDSVASKLLSAFPGTSLDLGTLLLEGKALHLAEVKSLATYAQTDDSIRATDDKKMEAELEHPTPIAAHLLPSLPASSLDYPAVVDWSPENEQPLMVTVNPIHGRELFSPDKSYLMVSLVSTMGRSICRYMVENGARHIALASRSARVDPQWLEEMAHLGADIRVYRMDVSDKTSVQNTVATMRAEMPPIAGVANAALVLRDRLFLDMQAPDMTEVLAPKVDGSLNLHEEFKDSTLDFFILFSTLSCVIGNAGQANYDAASLYQVMLAKHRRQQGLPASVMEIGAVADVGYVAERGQALFDKLARTMKLALSESDVHQIFAEAVAASPIREGEVVDSTTAEIVSGMGHYTYNANAPSEAHPPWFNNLLASHFVREERGSTVVTGATDGGQLSVAARLDAATSEEVAAAALTQALAGRVETMLQMPASNFKVDASLLDVGIDSLLAVELRTWFLKEIHVDVPVLKILSGESGEAICAFAAGQYLAGKSKVRTETPPAAQDADAATPDTDSDRGGVVSSSSSDVRRSPSPGSSDADSSAPATSVSTVESDSEEKGQEESEDVLRKVRSTAPMTHAQAR